MQAPKKTRTVKVTMPPPMAEHVTKQAEANYVTLSTYVKQLITDDMKRKGVADSHA